MDNLRVQISFERGASELHLLSQGFPGLTFTHLSYHDDLDLDPDGAYVCIQVSGVGDALVRCGFLNAEQLELVANCKTRKVLRDGGGACVEVDRRASRFRVRRRVPLDMIAGILAPHLWSPPAAAPAAIC